MAEADIPVETTGAVEELEMEGSGRLAVDFRCWSCHYVAGIGISVQDSGFAVWLCMVAQLLIV